MAASTVMMLLMSQSYDVSARGFWEALNYQRTFSDVAILRVFNPRKNSQHVTFMEIFVLELVATNFSLQHLPLVRPTGNL